MSYNSAKLKISVQQESSESTLVYTYMKYYAIVNKNEFKFLCVILHKSKKQITE